MAFGVFVYKLGPDLIAIVNVPLDVALDHQLRRFMLFCACVFGWAIFVGDD